MRPFLLGILTAGSMLLHGYHPYVVDASIYVAGIEKAINPRLYAWDGAFVSSHAKLSVFSFAMARLQMLSGLRLDWLLLLTYVGLVFLLLCVSHALGEKLFGGEAGGWGAALLTSACLPIPVAATSLLLVDPYLSARSFSTPLSLFAVLCCVSDSWVCAAGACFLTALVHPLMVLYLAAFLIVYKLAGMGRWGWIAAGSCGAFLACGALWMVTRHSSVTASYREAVMSRSYYFPTIWRWYELVGLFAPLLLLGLVWRSAGSTRALGRLAVTCLIVGGVCCACCFCFVSPRGPYLLARLQLLRSFHTIYAVGCVMLGGAVAKLATERRLLMPLALLLVCIAGGMLVMQRHTYKTLPDVELPGIAAANDWERGFLWIRDHAPEDAFFAVDPGLINREDEALPGFRAVARRSILIDVKDEGLASLFPALAPAWEANRSSEQLLTRLDEPAARQQLTARGVTWVLLAPGSTLRLLCPYANPTMKVCTLAAQ